MRANPFDAMRSAGAVSGASSKRVRQALVAAEVACSLILTAGAGLLAHSVVRMLRVDTGYAVGDALLVQCDPPQVADRAQLPAVYAEMEARMRAAPGVRDVASMNFHPFSHILYSTHYRLPGQSFASEDEAPFTNTRIVSSSYFRVMGIPILAGASFGDGPNRGREGRVVVSQSFAELHWPRESAVGRSFTLMGRQERAVEIVGVVGDVREFSLTEEPRPTLYLDSAETPVSGVWVIRTEGRPMSALDGVKAAIRAVDPTQPFRRFSTFKDEIARETAEPRFYMFLLSAFAVVALLLAAVGLYGVVAFSAVRRTREIGVRMALGADRPRILRMFASEGLWPALVGAVVGLGGAIALGRFLEAWLYGVTPTDPVTLGAVCALLAGVAWLASYLPARKAASLHPLEALRYE